MEHIHEPTKALSIHQDVVGAIQGCYDPEIPVNVYDLGLIYRIEVNPEEKTVHVDMTLTTPNCPSIETLPEEVRERIEEVEGIEVCYLQLVWEPQFTADLMSDEAKLTLGLL